MVTSSKYACLIAGTLLLLRSGSATASELQVDISKDMMSFIKGVVRTCLSTPDSSVTDVSSHQISLDDKSPDCAAEIQALASRWNRAPESFAAIHARDEVGKVSLMQKLRTRFRDTLKVEAQKSCPCLIVTGPALKDALSFARK